MPRLIDADALLKGKDDHQIISTHLIWNAPTVDAVEVVRCRDCKFWDRTNMVTDIGFPDLARCLRGHKDYSDEFWYCADGERISE